MSGGSRYKFDTNKHDNILDDDDCCDFSRDLASGDVENIGIGEDDDEDDI